MNNIDRRSLRKCNGANNPNATFTWKEIERIRKEAKDLRHYGQTKFLASKYNVSRHAMWKILTCQTYLKNPPPKEDNINALISEWVGT